MTSDELQPLVAEVLAELLPGRETDTAEALAVAGRVVSRRYDEHHRLSHENAQRGGAIIWAMRQRGMSWREIYDTTGIVQRTGARWVRLFVAEGIAQHTDTELRSRADGDQS